MPDVIALNDVYKIWGLGGVGMVAFIIAIRYMVTWLRTVIDKSDDRHEKTRADFLIALDSQRKEHSESLDKVVTRFDSIYQRADGKIDGLADKVDQLVVRIKS
jgi:hypothetical protein